MDTGYKHTETKITDRYGFTDVDGASWILGLSKSKIYKASAERVLPTYKRGKLYFKISELLAWVEAGKQ